MHSSVLKVQQDSATNKLCLVCMKHAVKAGEKALWKDHFWFRFFFPPGLYEPN
jgi:hypothetical protein